MKDCAIVVSVAIVSLTIQVNMIMMMYLAIDVTVQDALGARSNMFLWLMCKECDTEVEVYCDGDNAMMCPECRSIDRFNEIEE